MPFHLILTRCVHQLRKDGVRRLSLLRNRAFIAGEWTAASDGATFDVTNPATDDVIGTVPDLGPADARRAVAAAAECQATWQATPAKVSYTCRCCALCCNRWVLGFYLADFMGEYCWTQALLIYFVLPFIQSPCVTLRTRS